MSRTLPGRILRRLPTKWRAELASVDVKPIKSGMGGADVFRLRLDPVCYLKMVRGSTAKLLRQEIARTSWLAERGIRVAPIVRTLDDGRFVAMQTRALPGKPADRCDWPKHLLLPALGRALARLHALAAADCPFDESLSVRLKRARRAVEKGNVDARHFDSRNRKTKPRALLARLAADPPAEDIVVAHGDATLSNMIVAAGRPVGFIDCGHAGRADRYLDLAVIAAEIADRFGKHSVKIFANAYSKQRWNLTKAAFYADLYEFF
jgi:aminoglycoside phosphotransferase